MSPAERVELLHTIVALVVAMAALALLELWRQQRAGDDELDDGVGLDREHGSYWT